MLNLRAHTFTANNPNNPNARGNHEEVDHQMVTVQIAGGISISCDFGATVRAILIFSVATLVVYLFCLGVYKFTK